MGRIRSIKPEFPQSESMGNVSREARLTFIMLWTLADDEGRLRGNSRMLASLLFPYDQDAGDLIDDWLFELERECCIVRYKNGKDSYMQLCNWLIHQKIDKPSKSKIAPFDESSRILANPRVGIKDQGSKDQGSGIEGLDQGPEDQSTAAAVAAPAKKSTEPKAEPNPLNLETWKAYKQAYANRYGAAPVQDAATNSKIKSIVRALGAEAPAVATFFLSHNGARYVAAMHQIGYLATDYAKLRTEWATSTQMTQAKAQQADKTATNLDAFGPLIAEARAREEAERNQSCQAAK